jgi:S1-C subfamily serine protease
MGTRAAQLTRAGTAQQVVVVLIGSGHLQHKLGANLRAARARPDIPQLTVVESLVPEDQAHANAQVTVPLGLADLVRVGHYGNDSIKPASLSALKLSAAEGGIRVDEVRAGPGSAMRALKAGDAVESLNGKAFRHPVDLRLAYETFPRGSTAHWVVRREGKSVPLDLRVE